MKRARLAGSVCMAALAWIGGSAADAPGQNPQQPAPTTQSAQPQSPASRKQPSAQAVRSLAPYVQVAPDSADSVRIPGEVFIRYPDNWAEVLRRQERYGYLMQGMEDRPSRDTRRKLARIVPEISFETGVTFNDAIDRIRRDSGANIVVNWPALQLVGVTRDLEVSLPRLTNITWSKLLDLVLQQITAGLNGLARLDWAIQDGILTISTQDDLNTNLTLRVYDIGDLLVPRQTVPRGASALGASGSANSASSSGSGLTGANQSTP